MFVVTHIKPAWLLPLEEKDYSLEICINPS